MKSALIFFGGWPGHQPRECADLFVRELSACGFRVDAVDSLAVLDDAARLGGYSLIVPLWTMGTLTPEQEKNLAAAVRGGVGLAGFHGGMGDAFRGALHYQWMVGGQFVEHPDGIKDYPVRITDRTDPIMLGLDDFSVRTEQYYLLVDPQNHVLATTSFQSTSAPWTDGVVMPVVWKKQHGQGRVFYSALGHQVDEFTRCPPQLELTLRGMKWAAK